MKKIINLIVKSEYVGLRTDVFISKKESFLSRTRIKNLILKKKLKFNNQIITNPSKKISLGDNIVLEIPEPKKTSLKPYDFKLNVVYEDNDLLIINKPSGIIMHPGAGNYDQTIVNALIKYCKGNLSNIGDELRPGIVHRIDKDTSGILIIAKTRKFAQLLTSLFRIRKIYKTYLAICYGSLEKNSGELINDLTRYEGKKEIIENAKTIYNVIDKNNYCSLISLNPITGRKHQIRKQLSMIGNPVLGDNKYNFETKGKKLMLHAYSIKFMINDIKYNYKVKYPDYFQKVMKKKRLRFT
mgnify:CR=1 FL=1